MRGHVAQRGNPDAQQGPRVPCVQPSGCGTIFHPRGFPPFLKKEVIISTISRLVCAGPIPYRGEPALPVIRQLQVRREWCPETVFTG
jgi:hypothetical protein